MSMGNWQIGTVAPPFGSTERNGSFQCRQWQGGNDPKRVTPQSYYSVRMNAQFVRATTGSGPYLSVYTRGIPPWDKIRDHRSIMDGETANAAFNELADSVRGHDFSAVSNLAEIDETLALLQGALMNAYGALRDLSRFDIPSFARRLPAALQGGWTASTKRLNKSATSGDISKVWLAGQYGWLPIVQGIEDLLKMLEMHATPQQVVKFKGKKTAPWKEATVADPADPASTIRYRQTITYRATFTERPDPWKLAGFSWESFAGVLWERTPFSFVWDYFMPIGQMLSAWASLRSLPYASLVRTNFILWRPRKRSPWYVYFPDTNPSNNGTGVGSVDWTAYTVERTVMPTDIIHIPSIAGFERIFRGKRVENTIALVHTLGQSFRSDVRKWRPF